MLTKNQISFYRLQTVARNNGLIHNSLLSRIPIDLTLTNRSLSSRVTLVLSVLLCMYRMAKNLAHVLCLIISSNIHQRSDFFYCQNQEKICNNVVTKDPTTPQTCRYTTLWNVSWKQQLKTRRLL